jgi:hypothetical protein
MAVVEESMLLVGEVAAVVEGRANELPEGEAVEYYYSQRLAAAAAAAAVHRKVEGLEEAMAGQSVGRLEGEVVQEQSLYTSLEAG